MKHFFASFLALLLLGCLPATAQTATDSLPGQTRFVRQLADALCKRVEETKAKTPFESLSTKQADELFMRLMLASMGEQAEAMTALLNESKQRKQNPQETSRRIGEQTVLLMSSSCPGAMALLMRTTAAQKEMGKHAQSFNDVSTEEKAVLQPMADSACAQLNRANNRKPFKQLSPKERQETMGNVMQTAVIGNMAGLLGVYSIEQLSNRESLSALGVKMASLMMSTCPNYVIMMGEDRKASKR